MSREELARILARTNGLPSGAAADQLDCAIHGILKKLRHGRTAKLPGIGKFTPGTPPKFEFTPKPARKGSRNGRK